MNENGRTNGDFAKQEKSKSDAAIRFSKALNAGLLPGDMILSNEQAAIEGSRIQGYLPVIVVTSENGDLMLWAQEASKLSDTWCHQDVMRSLEASGVPFDRVSYNEMGERSYISAMALKYQDIKLKSERTALYLYPRGQELFSEEFISRARKIKTGYQIDQVFLGTENGNEFDFREVDLESDSKFPTVLSRDHLFLLNMAKEAGLTNNQFLRLDILINTLKRQGARYDIRELINEIKNEPEGHL